MLVVRSDYCCLFLKHFDQNLFAWYEQKIKQQNLHKVLLYCACALSMCQATHDQLA